MSQKQMGIAEDETPEEIALREAQATAQKALADVNKGEALETAKGILKIRRRRKSIQSNPY